MNEVTDRIPVSMRVPVDMVDVTLNSYQYYIRKQSYSEESI